MPRAYWVATYRSISDPKALQAYAVAAGPALTKAGGKPLVRGEPSVTYEAGQKMRTVVIQFDSVKQATDAHDSPDYQAALKLLGSGAVRDIRIVEGVEKGCSEGETAWNAEQGPHRSDALLLEEEAVAISISQIHPGFRRRGLRRRPAASR